MTFQDFSTYISEQGLEGFRHIAGFHVPQFDYEWCLMCKQEIEQLLHQEYESISDDERNDDWT